MAPDFASREAEASDSSESEASDVLDLKDDEGWEDAEPDEEEPEQIVSLLDNEVFPDVKSMLSHCKDAHQFDFLRLKSRYSLDFYGCIKLVNFIRSEVKNGRPLSSELSKEDFDKDDYLRPVMQDDALLFNLDEVLALTPDDGAASAASPALEDPGRLLARIAQLEEELHKTQTQFLDYKDTVAKTLNERWNDQASAGDAPAAQATEDKRDDDSHYFSSYSYNDIHETMLKDTVRTDAYRDFIYENKHLFAGKVVLDVGCGTGILSLFCAKAGAAQVIAVDNSAIIDKARENVYNNGFANTIVCLRGKIEEVTLPVQQVDIIVSEWMGYFLLYEAMLDSVIWARDKYLKPDGLMVPSHMNMWIAPISDPEYVLEHFSFWTDVYGFEMRAMQAGIYDDSQVLQMPAKAVCGSPYPFLQLDLHSTSTKDLTFKKEWKSTLTQDIDSMDGFLIWFDTFFMLSRNDAVPTDAKAEEWAQQRKKGIAFTTGPCGKETHWRQGVLFVDNAKGSASLKAGEAIAGELVYDTASDNSRALDIGVTWSTKSTKTSSQSWKMR